MDGAPGEVEEVSSLRDGDRERERERESERERGRWRGGGGGGGERESGQLVGRKVRETQKYIHTSRTKSCEGEPMVVGERSGLEVRGRGREGG